MAVNIFNTISNTLLSGTSGKDTIQNGGWKVNFYYEGGRYVTISGGSNDDNLINYGETVKVSGGKGNDVIRGCW